MKVTIMHDVVVKVEGADAETTRAVEISLAQFGEQLEACIEDKLRGQFPEMELSFGAVEEGR